MKKVLAILAAGFFCLGAFAQESNILNDWSDDISLSDKEYVTQFTYLTAFYNYNLGPLEGQSPHGFGFEVATAFLGFDIWKDARLSLGLIDFCFDLSSTLPGYAYASTDGKTVVPVNTQGLPIEMKEAESTSSNLAFHFPVAYTQKLGSSKWNLALLAAPGVGWDTYNNKYTLEYIEHDNNLTAKKNAYFRLNLSAYVRYSGFGLGVRYSFPKGFEGPGILSAGITIGI